MSESVMLAKNLQGVAGELVSDAVIPLVVAEPRQLTLGLGVLNAVLT